MGEKKQGETPKTQEASAAEREKACRAALLALAEKPNRLNLRAQNIALIRPLLAEIRAVRKAGHGFKAISKTLKQYGYNISDKGLEKAFKELEAKETQPAG